MKALVRILVVIGVLALVGIIAWKALTKDAATPEESEPTGSTTTTEAEQFPAPSPTPEEDAGAPESAMVTYTAAGFSPSTVTVRVGGTVTFVNDSSGAVWPASAMHPTHSVYPTTGGCLGSTFDACKSVQPGESWSFTFTVAGTWKYHNHLNAAEFGTIVVE